MISSLVGFGLQTANADGNTGDVTVPWQPHPEVWMLVLGAVALGWFATKVVQPKAVAAGYDPITRAQKLWFTVGVLGMWIVSDWPIHDVAEDYLYFVHMLQHLMLSILLPAAFVLATPRWLLELVINPDGRAWRWFTKVSRPVAAGLIFNALTLLLHWSAVVQVSADSGPTHFGFHVLVFSAGIIMWQPVISPIVEWRLTPITQCIYLFIMSIVPTIPSGWLLFSEGVVYRHYDTPSRLFGIDVLTDQQAAGVVMKLVGGFTLWAIIVVIFAKFALAEGERDRDDRRVRIAEAKRAAQAEAELTYESVTEAFERFPAPPESSSPTQ